VKAARKTPFETSKTSGRAVGAGAKRRRGGDFSLEEDKGHKNEPVEKRKLVYDGRYNRWEGVFNATIAYARGSL